MKYRWLKQHYATRNLRKFGCYPSAVLADKIYQTRKNKLFCSQRGIRLSGTPLGRRKASDTDTKIKRQMYKDSCERNAIEGHNGNSKRRFGFDRIFSKLDETAKTEAALIILAMNTSHRLVRWLALLFRSLCFSFNVPVFQQTLSYPPLICLRYYCLAQIDKLTAVPKIYVKAAPVGEKTALGAAFLVYRVPGITRGRIPHSRSAYTHMPVSVYLYPRNVYPKRQS